MTRQPGIRGLIALLVIAGAVVSGADLMIIGPWRAQLDTLRMTLDQARGRVTTRNTDSAAAVVGRDSQDRLFELAAEIGIRNGRSQDPLETYERLDHMARRLGVQVARREPVASGGQAPGESATAEREYKVDASGDYDAIVHLIWFLEGQRANVRVNSFALTPESGGDLDRVSLVLNVSYFVRPIPKALAASKVLAGVTADLGGEGER